MCAGTDFTLHGCPYAMRDAIYTDCPRLVHGYAAKPCEGCTREDTYTYTVQTIRLPRLPRRLRLRLWWNRRRLTRTQRALADDFNRRVDLELAGPFRVDRSGTGEIGRAIWGANATQCEDCGVAYDASRHERCPRCCPPS